MAGYVLHLQLTEEAIVRKVLSHLKNWNESQKSYTIVLITGMALTSHGTLPQTLYRSFPLTCNRFGKLQLHSHIRVGKDRRAWQDLDCYLFSEMLICVKERKPTQNAQFDASSPAATKKPKCTLKGSILIKKHLKDVNMSPGMYSATLSMAFDSNSDGL